jgi:hypothetical protein
MNRPLCPACQQRFCAINYYTTSGAHYRSRCEHCIKRNRKIKPPVPRWQLKGYKKKPTCDRCGFRAKFSAQLMVFHTDGNLNNNSIRNLKTVCQNCQIEIAKSDLTWKPGDLEPDV